jgi:hypothetical protein
MTYAVMVSTGDGPSRPGRLDLEPDCFSFSDGTRVQYRDLLDMYLERHSSEPPVLVLQPRTGERLRLASLEGLGALHELAEELFDARTRIAA